MAVQRGAARPPLDDGFGATLGRALQSRGLSLTSLQRRLADRGHRVSAGTLSYWRSGQRLPERPASLDAVTEIEDLLGLGTGALTGRIGPSRRPGPPSRQVEDGGSAPRALGVPEALRALGLGDVSREMYAVAVHATLDVDAAGLMTEQTLRTQLRATAPGAQRWFLLVFTERPTPEPMVIERVVGAHVGRSFARAEVGLFLWELVLPRPLDVGETVLIETRTLLRMPEVDSSYFHHLDRRTPEAVIWVRFDPAALPSRCVQTVQELDGPAVDTPLDLDGLHTTHVAARSFGPGRVGLTWEW